MSGSLNQLIDEINSSVGSIATLDFKPPGIFHNAITRSDHEFSDLLEKLIKDVDAEKEAPLFKVDEQIKIPTRKDGKHGILDYLTDRDLNMKRNRHIGLPDEKPIIHICDDFYSTLQNARLMKKRKLTRNSILLDVDAVTSSVMTGASSAALNTLSQKFQDHKNITQLIYALKNGTVITDNNSNRRKTMFVEDFPTASILKLLEGIATTWPSDGYQQEYQKQLKDYTDIHTKMEVLRDEVKLQEDQLATRTRTESTNSSSNIVGKLIEKEKRDIAGLEKEIAELEA